ncbi:ectoine synthase [Marinagarivorans algicola]|uniref:ectoine synthase n=1 Tax=Marinagarivorans algicola TaxID=1513270 RepID=UPI0006B42A74|nr:ectoine synthase [Marinagarivorans algicola]
MIVRDLKSAQEQGRKIVDPKNNWDSTRLILKEDNMGFSFHITTIYKGADFQMHYQNHLESVYCISGTGEIENLEDGKKYPISPGTLYVLNNNDKHILRAFEEMSMACVFNPPLTGREVHNAEGAYELSAGEI